MRSQAILRRLALRRPGSRRNAAPTTPVRRLGSQLRPAPEAQWLLVTSACLMPRAVGAFRRAGFQVIAAPCDWRAAEWRRLRRSASQNLAQADLAVRVHLGLLTYRVRDRSTSELFPNP